MVPREERALLAWQKGTGRCRHCERLLRRDQYREALPAGWVVDFGSDRSYVPTLTCWGCYALKGDMNDEQWRRVIQHRYGGRGPRWRNRRLQREH